MQVVKRRRHDLKDPIKGPLTSVKLFVFRRLYFPISVNKFNATVPMIGRVGGCGLVEVGFTREQSRASVSKLDIYILGVMARGLRSVAIRWRFVIVLLPT